MSTQPIWLSPSLLSADFSRLGDEVRALEAAGVNLIHFDVMDNHYVPNLTFGPMVCKSLRPHTTLPLDVHLMVEPVDSLILPFAEAGANYIGFHPESSKHVDRSLQLIRDCGCLATLVFNPCTPLSWLDYVMKKVDMILIMGVNPGFGGQKFIPAMLEKISLVRRRITTHLTTGGQPIRLQVDGGVNAENIAHMVEQGADTFVAGNAIFGSPDANGGYHNSTNNLRKNAEKVRRA
jgi:ribulose-phosphate 3-epimerase